MKIQNLTGDEDLSIVKMFHAGLVDDGEPVIIIESARLDGSIHRSVIGIEKFFAESQQVMAAFDRDKHHINKRYQKN